jgi:phosphoenolpyruvate carboxylase
VKTFIALGALLGEVLKEQGGEQLFNVVEQDRLVAIDRRASASAAANADLLAMRCAAGHPQARDLVRAFSAWFQLVNVAEKVHRIRRRREYFQQETKPQPGVSKMRSANCSRRG